MKQQNLYDVVIIGGGPAGLTASIYLARARYRVLVVEKEHFGGQITITSEIVNYPGIEQTSGTALTDAMRKQAQNFGAEFLLAEVEQLDMEKDIKMIHTSRGDFSCFGVLLATGAHPRKVGFRGEEEFQGHGVAYCATCDGEFFTGKDVFVIGGGFAAAEESVFLTKYARHVTILIREDDFTCAKATADVAKSHEKITVVTNVQVEEVSGESSLQRIRYRHQKTGQVTEYVSSQGETFGVFVFAGYEPATDLIKNLAKCNEQGYVITDRKQQTNVEGLYAAGDVCVKNLRQVVTAVGDGALAATELEKYVTVMQQKTGIRPVFPVAKVPIATEQEYMEEKSQELFTADMKSQLETVFSRMERPLLLKLYVDERPVSRELEQYITALTAMTEKISFQYAASVVEKELPYISICNREGEETGLAFHGVPGGHEFTSFILSLYNASGPGQALDTDVEREIREICHPIHMKVLVSLSCTMCPELVTAAQRIASLNPLITAEVYDLNYFPDLKEQYQVMSVPCLVINEERVSFGKKNIRQLLRVIKENTK